MFLQAVFLFFSHQESKKPMISTIGLEAFTTNVRIGVSDQERSTPQPIRITLSIRADIAKAMESDDLNDTVDYAKLRQQILELTESRTFHLLERLAGDIINACFHDKRVLACQLRLEKTTIFPDAIPFLSTPWIERQR